MSPRHFLDLADHSAAELRMILDASAAMKRARAGLPRGSPDRARVLEGRVVALVFEQPSTRTRVSFQVGIHQLGGTCLTLSKQELHLGRGETIADTARVLSRYVDAILLRTDDHAKLLELARHASVPVVNGLTDKGHPCQVMADIETFEEARGPIGGKKIAWVGDTNNVALSWIEAAAKFKFRLALAAPAPYRPQAEVLARARKEGAEIEIAESAAAAVSGADAVSTDAWVSMTHQDRDARLAAFGPYQVNEALMAKAPGAVFLHCLPAHRGEEVTDGVLDGPQSLAWDEAENRLHVQKAILRWCFDV
ncbi:MAG: ornithine carbamoyltransferase [Alphaproteobacteria bacterium]